MSAYLIANLFGKSFNFNKYTLNWFILYMESKMELYNKKSSKKYNIKSIIKNIIRVNLIKFYLFIILDKKCPKTKQILSLVPVLIRINK